MEGAEAPDGADGADGADGDGEADAVSETGFAADAIECGTFSSGPLHENPMQMLKKTPHPALPLHRIVRILKAPTALLLPYIAPNP